MSTTSDTVVAANADALGRGTASVTLEADSTSPFSVLPDPPIEDLVLSCSIEVATIQVRK